MAAAERDRKLLEDQLQDVSRRIETATSALQDLQRQVRAAEVRTLQTDASICHACSSPSWPGTSACSIHFQEQLPQCSLLPHQLKSVPCELTADLMWLLGLQAELATDMHAGLSAAERRQLAELQPQIGALQQELKQAKKARSQVRCTALPLLYHGPLPLLYIGHTYIISHLVGLVPKAD